MRIPSTKLDRMVECESILEGNVALLLEHSPGVSTYREQPALIEYWDGELMRDYFPDFEAVLLDGTRVHLEAKHSRALAKPKIARKYRAIATHYQGMPIQFRIVTELECQQEPLRSNLRRLNYLRLKVTAEALPSREALSHLIGSTTTLACLEASLGVTVTWRLLAVGLVHCDLTAEITPATLVSTAEGDRHASLLF
ncbi:MAG TPA: hypothetical protein VGK09_02425 [Rhodocyclaceae bacterium]|jgi:hypothetical protein